MIFDTHALVWYGAGNPQFSRRVRQEAERPDCRVFVSAVTAWEYSDLRARRRLPDAPPFEELQSEMAFELLDLPGQVWTRAASLPNIHGDPVDRMLVAHALEAALVLVTADRALRSYPVKTLW